MRVVEEVILGVAVRLVSGDSLVCFKTTSVGAIEEANKTNPLERFLEKAEPYLKELNDLEHAEYLINLSGIDSRPNPRFKYVETVCAEMEIEDPVSFLKGIESNRYYTTHFSDEDKRKLPLLISGISSRSVKQSAIKRRRSDFDSKRDQIMLALIERDGYQCQLTRSTEDLTIDHIVPLSKGGSDDIDNLRLVTRSVNSSKGSNPL